MTTILVGNERMPTEIGWQRRNTTMRGSERIKYTLKLMKSADVNGGDTKADARRRSLFH